MVDGIRLGIDGMQTSCGATLIASQNIAVLAQDLGFRAHAGNAKSASPESDSSSERIRAKAPDHVFCDHADTAVAVAEYIVREMKTNPFSVEGRKILGANSADPDAQTAEWHRLRWHEKWLGDPTITQRPRPKRLPPMQCGSSALALAGHGTISHFCDNGRGRTALIEAGKNWVILTTTTTSGRTSTMDMSGWPWALAKPSCFTGRAWRKRYQTPIGP